MIGLKGMLPKDVAWMIGSLLAYVVLKFTLPLLPAAPSIPILYASMLILMATAFAFIRAVATRRLQWKFDVTAIAICFAAWMAGFLLGETVKGNRSSEIAGTVQEVGLIGIASFGGKVTSLIMREGSMLLPAAIAMMLVDVWCVNVSGTTPKVAERAREVFKAMTIKLPPAGAKRMPTPPLLIGFGDIFFATFIMAAMWRFCLDIRVAFWLAIATTAFGLTIVALLDIELAGLPFIAIGLLLPNIKKMKLSKEEWIATAIVIGALALILLASWIMLNR